MRFCHDQTDDARPKKTCPQERFGPARLHGGLCANDHLGCLNKSTALFEHGAI